MDAHATPENTRPELLVRSVHFYIGGKPAGSYTTEKYERIHFPMSKDYNKVGYNDKSGLHLGHGFCGRYFSSAFTGKTEKNHCWHFKGHIDELKLWKTAMSTTNVETHHLNPVLSWHPDLSHLMYYFTFDHGSGVNIVPKNYTVGQHVQSRGTNMILYPEKKLELIWDNITNHSALPEGSIYAPPPPPPSPPPPPPATAASRLTARDPLRDVSAERGRNAECSLKPPVLLKPRRGASGARRMGPLEAAARRAGGTAAGRGAQAPPSERRVRFTSSVLGGTSADDGGGEEVGKKVAVAKDERAGNRPQRDLFSRDARVVPWWERKL